MSKKYLDTTAPAIGEILVSLLLLFYLCTGPARADDPGWSITQSGQIYGRSQFAITAKGFRTDCLDAGYTLVSAAPSWKIFLFNEKSKSYFPFNAEATTNVSSGRTSLLRTALMRNAEECYWRKAYKTKFKGHDITVWRTAPKNPKVSKNFKVMELWTADEIPLAREIAAFDHKVNGLPKEMANLPLRCFAVASKRARSAFIETTSIEPGAFPVTKFRVPQGYKLARNEIDVVMNTDDLSNILEGIGGDK